MPSGKEVRVARVRENLVRARFASSQECLQAKPQAFALTCPFPR